MLYLSSRFGRKKLGFTGREESYRTMVRNNQSLKMFKLFIIVLDDGMFYSLRTSKSIKVIRRYVFSVFQIKNLKT